VLKIFRKLRRRRLSRKPFPGEWIGYLQQNVPFYKNLAPELKESFHHKLKIFVWEKHFVGAGGLEISDEIKVVIAAAAVRLILYLDISHYDRLSEIVVYPHHYKHPKGEGVMFGEAHHFGTVVLSDTAVRFGLRNPCDGHDTASHEFAHVLDKAGGNFNGTPKLRESEHYNPWAQVMSEHFLKLQKGHRIQREVLRQYGAKNEAEFFAVATESFFERPVQMKELTPDLYEELKRFYGFDPYKDPTCGSPR
jgi:Mlc titration factor MtfA (ptsG expression regulator)